MPAQGATRRPFEQPPRYLDPDGAAGGELRFVGGIPYCSFASGWFRHRAVSLGAARSPGHNHAVRVR
jgi:hypothetical protein